jgi:hypothetical protein
MYKVCSDCNIRKTKHCLGKKCMQEIINKCNKQGVVEEFERMLIRARSKPIDLWAVIYIEKRLRELNKKGVKK